MNKGPSALISAAFLAVALGGCSDDADKPLHSCQEGLRSATVKTFQVPGGQSLTDAAFPVVSVALYKRQGNIKSAASITPIYIESTRRPTPAEIQDAQAIAAAYCANGTVPALKP